MATSMNVMAREAVPLLQRPVIHTINKSSAKRVIYWATYKRDRTLMRGSGPSRDEAVAKLLAELGKHGFPCQRESYNIEEKV